MNKIIWNVVYFGLIVVGGLFIVNSDINFIPAFILGLSVGTVLGILYNMYVKE